MFHKLVTVLLCPCLLAGCITTYRGYPEVDKNLARPIKGNIPLYFSSGPRTYWTGRISRGGPYSGFPFSTPFWFDPPKDRYDKLLRVFSEKWVYSQTIPLGHFPPEKGLYCLIVSNYQFPSKVENIWVNFSFGSLTFIPFYTDSASETVTYELYLDQKLLKSYEYTITSEFLSLLPLLLFSWINAFTVEYSEALEFTAYQFFLDAERDGYFKKVGSDTE